MDGSPCARTDEPVDVLAVATAAFLPQLQLLPLIAMLTGVMAVGCGAMLVLRRLAGGIATPPTAAAVLTVCAAGLLLVTVCDLAMRASVARKSRAAVAWLPAVLTWLPGVHTWLPVWLARLGLLMAVAAVSLPLRMTPSFDALATIAVVVVSLGIVARGWLSRRQTTAAVRGLPASTTAVPPSAAVPIAMPLQTGRLHPVNQARPEGVRTEGAALAFPPNGSLLQRFERLALPEGGECVRGRLSVVVSEGSRLGYAHVGFCPPLASQPTIDVSTDYDGVEAVVSAAEVLPWGARIECRLDEPAEETVEIPVDILATSSA
jgi:hypothetical protein